MFLAKLVDKTYLKFKTWYQCNIFRYFLGAQLILIPIYYVANALSLYDKTFYPHFIKIMKIDDFLLQVKQVWNYPTHFNFP